MSLELKTATTSISRTSDLIENIEFRAVTNKYQEELCLTGGKFKDCYNKHQLDIRLDKNAASKLANHVCNLKRNNIQYDISWEIVTRAPPFNPTSRVCRLCVTEAYHIIFTPGGANLNKKDELSGFCKHKWNKLLAKEKT